MRTAALATVLVALSSQTLAASWASRRAFKNAVAARELPHFNPELFFNSFPIKEPVTLPWRPEAAIQAREPATLDPLQQLVAYNSPDMMKQVFNNFKHGIIQLRRDLEHNEARARQELAMREYERDLLTSLLESRVFDELD